ncbi:septum formation protein [Clostridium acetobutylicum]|uniref:dTTP/UTP pyrophosphatase n=1 Tax=Clostridium acetobutylicum (strain ATCC 824 / DSM 792 / JCM 1419 / IAM 19013 / LMG 5710 / NBRC 13948 / NRRL B-527 / VKM B-1787 / 2291 / W) TaxID=272562 RepID=NTPPA_CLOAB|nr:MULTISPECIES: Maf-like protein [Clostridium]Q97JN3.1 RecName: Full=dTTP/UTP pyrophosphatase; Short=dTTPase/UTPase; AltName: Full=Nucleoside triphosphate pyrophosphatase; AltName: Full=Nucleotide pyrophosphatase; Short=Nucleotide PPase [Clostridium acetobutylicum ATCC 824]AAK79212.1 Maf protein ortholog, putative inhibitor of septum formation [Clostridium acetobutylicum ATCC 824]ADZ20291.1 Maf-like protein [Clostridium acetobutylicum EA 2018]AEI33489.1 Maf-like protein [Clostridium acetobutyl
MKLVLASASPRRREILKNITEDFIVVASDFDESLIEISRDIQSYVMVLAESKAKSTLCRIESEDFYKDEDEVFIIGCDTVVSIDGKILGKPKDEKEALDMLSELSGRTHEVYSGLAVLDAKKNKIIKDFQCTEVKFSEISYETILKYIACGEYADKAGAYGIQGKASVFVEEIKGSYYNVVGLPINKLYKILLGMGVNL